MADTNSDSNANSFLTEELVEVLQETTSALVLDIQNVDTDKILEAFANAFSNAGVGNPFSTGSNGLDNLLYNEDPFASENFWNIFANGQDPTQITWNQDNINDFLTGGNPFTGVSSNPFSSGGNPFTGDSSDNPFSSGSFPFTGDSTSNPFSSGGFLFA